MINLSKVEKTIGYGFNNPDLLTQAFIRRSHSEENGGENNEILEFIGDKALDIAVIRVMMDKFGDIFSEEVSSPYIEGNFDFFKTPFGEGKFTEIKQDLVKKKALAGFMEKMGLQSELIMGNGDKLQNIQDKDSVKEDLFEAIIGAVTLDCNWNFKTILKVVSNMIDFDEFFANECSNEVNYVSKVQNWFQKWQNKIPEYEISDNVSNFKCTLKIDDRVFEGVGKSKDEAKSKCAEEVYIGFDLGFMVNPIELALGQFAPDEAISKLNELAQKKLIETPKYEDILLGYDEKGITVWKSICAVKGYGTSESICHSLKIGKRKSAYQMLSKIISLN